MRSPFALLPVLVAAACATEPSFVAQEATVTRCTKEMPTGSNRIVTVCRSGEDASREQQEAREVAERLGRPQGRTVGAGGP